MLLLFQSLMVRLLKYSELEDRDREHNEAPMTQGEMVSDLLHDLETNNSMELDGFHLRVLNL